MSDLPERVPLFHDNRHDTVQWNKDIEFLTKLKGIMEEHGVISIGISDTVGGGDWSIATFHREKGGLMCFGVGRKRITIDDIAGNIGKSKQLIERN